MFILISQHRPKYIDIFFWVSKMRDLLAPWRKNEMKFIRPLFLITLDHFANNFDDAIYCLVCFLGAVSFSLTHFASLCFFFAVNLRALPDLAIISPSSVTTIWTFPDLSCRGRPWGTGPLPGTLNVLLDNEGETTRLERRVKSWGEIAWWEVGGLVGAISPQLTL